MRISRIADNLRSIQKDIAVLAGRELESSVPGETVDVNALRRVKSSVDHLRQVLRAYIEFASTHVADSETMQRDRTERTIQILRYACADLESREGNDGEAPMSLFKQLTQLGLNAVERYGTGAPAERARESTASAAD